MPLVWFLSKLTVLALIRQLESTEGLHWFCPRKDGDNSETYPSVTTRSATDTEDSKPNVEYQKKIDQGERRRELVLDCLLILAYDGEAVAKHQESLKRRLDHELGKCDVCIRGYYRGKRELMQKLNKYAVL